MSIPTILTVLFSVLMPSKLWYTPSEPLTVTNQSDQPVNLIATFFDGRRLDTTMPTLLEAGKSVDVKEMFPAMRVGTYIIYAVPAGKRVDEFVGTPIVLEFRGDDRPGAPPGTVVIRVEPLCVAKIETSVGDMTLALYYDVAPNTVTNFANLSRGGFYDGLTFHRVIPGFIAQSGDPLASNLGGPGYTIPAEFNDKQMREGVIAMAREADPLEKTGVPARPEYADTAGSQFFFSLNYDRTKQLDHKYTAFGRIVEGMETLQKIGSVKIADANSGRPEDPPAIKSIKIVPVMPGKDPYPTLMIDASGNPTTQPVSP